MKEYIIVIGIYLLAINVMSFAMFGLDKHKARKHSFRISEKGLFVSALLGGSIGALLGMKVFRHKTQHKKFIIGIPMILVCQIAIIIWFVWKANFA